MNQALNVKGFRVLGIVLIVLVGLLNFHIPHFLFPAWDTAGVAGNLLELLLLVNVVGALVSCDRHRSTATRKGNHTVGFRLAGSGQTTYWQIE